MPKLAGSADRSAHPLAGRENVISWRKPLLRLRTESGGPLQAPAAHGAQLLFFTSFITRAAMKS